MPRKFRAHVGFIFVTILIDAIGIGIIIPVLPDVIRRFSSDPTYINEHFGIFISIYALMQFFASPILGSLSDRFGRRPILLVSLCGASIDYLLMAFAPTLPLLYLGRVFSGLTGASQTVAGSYMADISDDSNRGANFGIIGAAWGVGFILGPLLGGILGEWGTNVPFLGSAVLCGLNFLWGLAVLPESLPANHRRPFELNRLNPFASLVKILQPSLILPHVIVFFLIFLAGQSHPSIWTLYTKHKFHWTSVQVGMSLAFVGFAIAVVQGGVTRVAIPRLGENRALGWGLFFYILGFALFSVANQGWMMYAIMAIFAFSGLAMPSLQSLISRSTPPEKQGELQGSLMSLGSLASILGPLLYTQLFDVFTNRAPAGVVFPGAPYMMASALCVVAWSLERARKSRIRV